MELAWGEYKVPDLTHLQRGARRDPPPGGGRRRRQPLRAGRGRHWGGVGTVQGGLTGQSQPGQFLPDGGLFEPRHFPPAAFGRLRRLWEGAWLVCGGHYPDPGGDITYLITFLFVISSPAIIKISQIADSLKRFL